MSQAKWIMAAALIAAVGAGGYWAGRNSAPHGGEQAAVPSAAPGAGGRKILYYRNPMGLPDTSPVPRKDPMGMDYVPVYEGEERAQSEPPGTVKISPDKVQILGVRTEPVQQRELKRMVQAVGTVQPNERLLYKIAPRFEGWIEKLHVNTTGQAVARGQVLMEVYSPELVAAQEEYLIAVRGARELKEAGADAQATMQRLSEATLRRLRNWDISERELEALQAEGAPRRVLAYRSPVNGVVLQKPSVQGMRFMPGESLYEIADLSSVWLLADVAEQDLGRVRLGQSAAVRIAAYPGRPFSGKVAFLYPTLEESTRTGRVRIELANPAGLLKPAMYGNVEIASTGSGKALAVPDSAVLDSGSRQVVLVRRGEGLFEPRDVKLGMRADGYAEVREGLQAGEEVVVRANFLIDAESNLRAALSSFGAPAQPARPPQLHRGEGRVESVNAAAGIVEIDHGPIASLKWPPMKMAFKADPKLLSGLKPGQAVQFELTEPRPGEYVIQSVRPRG